MGGAAEDLRLLAAYRLGADPAWGPIMEGIRERGEPTARGQLALSGDDLVRAGVPAGPALGQLLARLLEAVLEAPALNTRDRLLEKVRAWS